MKKKLRETNIIKSILCNNEYNTNIVDTLIHKKQKKKQNNTTEDKAQKMSHIHIQYQRSEKNY
jgi:hypothetical protein